MIWVVVMVMTVVVVIEGKGRWLIVIDVGDGIVVLRARGSDEEDGVEENEGDSSNGGDSGDDDGVVMLVKIETGW